MTSPQTPAILIVEDERIVAKDLQQTLSGMGYDAFGIASSSEEALARAAEKRPDIVLIDIRIKGERDGIETAQDLRNQFGVSIVYLTAHADEVTIERAKKTSPDGYLIKPVKARDLKETIEIAVRARKKPGVVCKPDDNGQH
jgi:CheY-like chemotaxis protein